MNTQRISHKSKWFITGLIALAVIAYGSGCAYMWVNQKYYIFMPQREISQTPADHNLAFEDLYLPVSSTNKGVIERMHCWWIPNDRLTGRYLIYLHGSAFNIGANVNHARRFKDLGFSVLLISYRGYGRSEGHFPTEAQVYADAEAGWDYLVDQKGIQPGDIFIYGHSLGAAVAINLAVAHPGAGGLIVEGAFTSITDMGRQNALYRLLPIDLITHQRFDSISKIRRLKMPVLIMHGTEDRVVPFEMSRQLYEKAPSPKRLKLILGGGHNNSARVGGAEYLNTVREFIAQVHERS
ncbi:MAG: alpha/beta fold hydrolase [Desulfobacterales bacterium]